MTDGYEQDDKDVVTNDKTISSSTLSCEEIYHMLGCEVFDE